VVAIGLLGFLDDYVKISRQNSGGISGKQKIAGQVLAASIFGYLGLQFADKDGYTPLSLQLSTVRDTSITLGVVAVVIWIAFMVTATSNGVNLTDGLDGLATGAAVMTFIAFVLIGVWEFGQSCAVVATSNCYQVRDPLDLAVLSAAFAGSCTGFLWWNASPAKIFMGDSGSMFLGLLLAASAITLTGQIDPNAISAEKLGPTLLPLMLPFAVLAIPLIDLFSAIFRRLRAGQSPFSSDKEHMHHRILRAGNSHLRTSIIMYLWTATIAFPVTVLAFAPWWVALITVIVFVGASVFVMKTGKKTPVEIK
jgi:UDP-N-acetylmuramyl pentapeptide phosphotransferase/UDP-N-acetylglucosamine-1-phosphate transferase